MVMPLNLNYENLYAMRVFPVQKGAIESKKADELNVIKKRQKTRFYRFVTKNVTYPVTVFVIFMLSKTKNYSGKD